MTGIKAFLRKVQTIVGVAATETLKLESLAPILSGWVSTAVALSGSNPQLVRVAGLVGVVISAAVVAIPRVYIALKAIESDLSKITNQK